jgi:transposase
MIQIAPQMRLLVAVEPADFRRGIDGLVRVCREALGADPFSGELYLFIKQSRKLCKVLLWDGTGLCSASTTSCAAERSPPSQARSCHRSIRILPSSPAA